MILDYSVPWQVSIDMKYYVQGMLDQFKHELSDKITTPASENLFKINKQSPKLDKNLAEEFHTTVAHGLFVSKQARPDVQPTIAFLCTWVREPMKDDWNKLSRLMSYLKKTKDDVMVQWVQVQCNWSRRNRRWIRGVWRKPSWSQRMMWLHKSFGRATFWKHKASKSIWISSINE